MAMLPCACGKVLACYGSLVCTGTAMLRCRYAGHGRLDPGYTTDDTAANADGSGSE